MIHEFKEYWVKTKGILDFKMRSMSDGHNRVPIKAIIEYYQTEIIDKLWFSEHFPSKYNDWVEINLPSSNPKRLEVKKTMSRMSVPSLAKKMTSVVMICAGVLLVILPILLYIAIGKMQYVSILISCLGLFLTGCGIYARKYLVGYCRIENIESEMDRIEKEVIKLLS